MYAIITLIIALLFAAPVLAEDAGAGTWTSDAAGNRDCAKVAGKDPAVGDGEMTVCYHSFTADTNTEPIKVGGSNNRICVVQVTGDSNAVTVYAMDHGGATTDAEAQPLPGMTSWVSSPPCQDLPGNFNYYVTVAWTTGTTRVSIREDR